MYKVFLWCECSYTRLGITSLLDEKFNVLNGRSHQDLARVDECDLSIFIISSCNMFDVAMFMRKNKEFMDGRRILIISKANHLNLFNFIFDSEIKKLSLSQFLLNFDTSLEEALHANLNIDSRIHSKVTTKELIVMGLIMRGESVTEIASELNRSIKTISLQKASFLKKIGLKNRLTTFYRYFYAR